MRTQVTALKCYISYIKKKFWLINKIFQVANESVKCLHSKLFSKYIFGFAPQLFLDA